MIQNNHIYISELLFFEFIFNIYMFKLIFNANRVAEYQSNLRYDDYLLISDDEKICIANTHTINIIGYAQSKTQNRSFIYPFYRVYNKSLIPDQIMQNLSGTMEETIQYLSDKDVRMYLVDLIENRLKPLEFDILNMNLDCDYFDAKFNYTVGHTQSTDIEDSLSFEDMEILKLVVDCEIYVFNSRKLSLVNFISHEIVADDESYELNHEIVKLSGIDIDVTRTYCLFVCIYNNLKKIVEDHIYGTCTVKPIQV